MFTGADYDVLGVPWHCAQEWGGAVDVEVWRVAGAGWEGGGWALWGLRDGDGREGDDGDGDAEAGEGAG